MIPPQTYDRGDNLALALPWVAGYRSYKSYKSYRHWLVMTLTSVASARRGWLMAPLPNLTLRPSQLEAAASYFGVDVRPTCPTKRRTRHSCTNRAFTSTEGFCYRSYFWLRVIPPQTYDWGDNLAHALPWVAGYRPYRPHKPYRHWLVITLTSVASARRGWLMAPLPNLTLRFSQLVAAASYFGVDVRPALLKKY